MWRREVVVEWGGAGRWFGMRIVNGAGKCQTLAIRRAPSRASGSYHLLIKMSKLSQWHWLMTMETFEMMMLLMLTMRSSAMYPTLAWGSRVACGWLQDANAKCFLPVLLKRQVPATWMLGRGSRKRRQQQHSTRIHCLSDFNFFELQPVTQAGRQAGSHPSIHQCWMRVALEAIISITILWLSWFMASIEFWLTISQAFKVSVSRIRYLWNVCVYVVFFFCIFLLSFILRCQYL